LVLEAFDTLFNRRDYAAAQRFWSPDYIQHSAHIEPGRDGLFDLIKAAPAEMRYENALTIAKRRLRDAARPILQYRVICQLDRRRRRPFAGRIARRTLGCYCRTRQPPRNPKSGLPMFGDTFPTRP